MAATGLLDDAMAKFGGKSWSLLTLDAPVCHSKSEDDIENPITLEAFVAAVGRGCEGLAKTVNMLFDVHLSLPEFPFSQLVDAMKEQALEKLPCNIKPPSPMPSGCRLTFVAQNKRDGTIDLLKILHFESRISKDEALALCTGTPYALVLRPGPWALRKAVFALVARLPGLHVAWFTLKQQEQGRAARRSHSSQWAPADEELWAGIQYINDNAPECDSQNQQYYWILCSIKEGSGTPISGWPEAKVRLMAQNKSRGMAGAQLETSFPLTTYSLKPFLAKYMLPLLYPLFMNFAFMFLGWPGVGKTPAIIIMMLAMGRYHATRLGLPTPAGWRRAKSLDNFRHRVGNVHEGVFLDDPSRDKIELADLKSFVTAEEHQTCQGRYNDVKLAKNCCRAYASNDLQQEDEPKEDSRLAITMEEFLTMLRHTFPGDKPADIRAVLKRTVVFVFGKSALYLRLPSQQDDAPIHRINIEAIHQDLLADRDKLSYGKYKGGMMENPSGYEDFVSQEQEMISQSMTEYLSYASAQDYVKEVNGQLYDLLLHKQPIPAKAWLPSSPEPSSPEMPGPIYRDPLPGSVPKRIGKFVYPPNRRLRRKTSDPTSPGPASTSPGPASTSALSPLEALVQDAYADLGERGDDVEALHDEDFSADEEAAAFMGC